MRMRMMMMMMSMTRKKKRVLDIVPGVPPSLAQPEILGVSLVPLATPELPDLHGEESGGHHRTPCESPRV
jgi:hypothetical protein